MDELQKKLVAQFGEQRVLSHEPLTNYVSSALFAPLFITISSKKELIDAVILAKGLHIPFFILDQDASKLEEKKDVDGLVIKNNARKFDIIARKGKMQSRRLITDYALLEAESGVPVSQLVRYTLDEGLSGMEELLGVGGSLGKLLTDESLGMISRLPIQSVTILTQDSEAVEVEPKDLKKNLLVLSVIFKLVGEESKILWLKAKKAAESRGITEYL